MALGISAIAASIGGTLSNIASGAIAVIKITASISFALIFAGAILSLLGFIESVVATSVVGEIFGILSVCLPFNAGTVFYGVILIIDAILAFLVARKTYELVSNLISVSGH